MNKISAILTIMGLIVLGILGYFVLKPSAVPVNPIPVSEFEELFISYRSSEEFSPKSLRVEQGKKVRIKITSDIAYEVHLHGYEGGVDVVPGQEAVLEFVADKTGRFDIEFEEIKKIIAVIEVYPK